MNNNTYLIAMSGGVDSSTAAALVLEGNRVRDAVGATLAMGFGGDGQNSADAASVAERLGIAHVTLDCAGRFRRDVVGYFAQTYANGMTPNPCVICNRCVKFGFLAEKADRMGRRFIVTGHYARVDTVAGRRVIRKAADPMKDQSYMLAMLTPAQVERIVLPLGEFTKPQVRQMAAERGFVTAGKHDSQDICFIPDGDYVSFLRENCGIAPVPGDYLDGTGRVLGRHKGQLCYTIGQRKGLGISMGRHIFVLSKDADTNTVVLGDEPELFRQTVEVTGFNPQSVDDIAGLDGRVYHVKLRYSQRESAARVAVTGTDSLTLTFDEPQRAPSPGQFAVLYDGDVLVGGGTISREKQV